MNRKLLTMAVAGLLSVAGLSAQEPPIEMGNFARWYGA